MTCTIADLACCSASALLPRHVVCTIGLGYMLLEVCCPMQPPAINTHIPLCLTSVIIVVLNNQESVTHTASFQTWLPEE